MELSELRTRLTALLQTDLDNYAGETPADADLEAQLNRAQRIIARFVQPRFEKVAISISNGDQNFSLDSSKFARPMMKLDREIWRSSGNCILQVPFEELDQTTDWRFATAGTPVMFALSDNNIWFDRPFSGSSTIYCSGVGYYVDLVDDTDIPEIPVDYHDTIPEIAAILAAEPSVTDSVAMNRLQLYSNRSLESLREYKQMTAYNNFDFSNTRGNRF